MKSLLLAIILSLTTACGAKLDLMGMQSSQPDTVKSLSLDRYVAASGDTVQVIGKNLTADLIVLINDEAVPYTFVDGVHGSFVYTHDKIEMTTITLKRADKTLAQFPMIDPSMQDDLPQTSVAADQICSDTLARNADGQIFQGTANCAAAVANCDKDGGTNCIATDDFPFTLTEGLAAKVVTGQVIAGVAGAASARAPDCASDGQSQCVVDGTQFRAANPGLSPYDLRSGVQFAGVSGSLFLSLPACASDGQTDCMSSVSFPAIDKIRLSQNASSILTGQSLAGVAGVLGLCASDGENGCLIQGSGFAAIDKITAAPKIVSGQTIGDVTGTGLSRPGNCSADGQTNCVAITAYPALDKSVLLAGVSKVSADLTIAGTSGTLPSCSSEGQTACLGVSSYPAIDKNKVSTFASSIRTGVSLVGVSGTLDDCSADAQTSCVTTVNFPVLDKTGAAAKILVGQTLGGVSGSAALRPSDCAVDGSVNCVAVAAFPAMNSSIAAAKILTGQTLAGVSGAAALTPNACASDGDISCVASTTYPALDKTHLTSVVSSIKSDLTLAGVSGSLSDCAADGDSDCVVVGPLFKAAALTGAGAKIISGQIVAGVSGTVTAKPLDCSLDGGTSCVTTASFPAIAAATAPGKIVAGQVVGGVTGTATNYRPSDCANDGETGCTATVNFPTLDASTSASKIASGDSLGGIAGTASVRPSDCSLEGATNCVAVTAFPTVDKISLNSQKALMKSDLTIVGVTGTMIDCASDGATNCQAVAAYPSTIASTVAAKVLTGSSLAGVAGSAPLRPSDCSTDGHTACVATSNYPAINKTTVTAGSLRSGLTLGGVAGTLADCAADGGTDCVAVTGYVAANSTGAAAKILSGQTLAGISGTAAAKPSDCSSDGALGCTAVTAFPAIGLSGLNAVKNQYRTTQTIASVSGTLSDCAADAATGCVAIASYPAMNTNLAAAKIASGSTLGGISGTAAVKPGDCAIDGGTGCVTLAAFPSVDAAALVGKAPKLRASQTLAGVTGTLADCSADGITGCVASGTYPAAMVSGAASKIRTGQTLAGVAGTALLPPAACATDNATNCISSATIPAVDLTALNTKASKYTGMTLDSVAGTLANCSSDNSFGCITSLTNPAADATVLTAGNIKKGTTFGGVTGAYPSSTSPLAGATATAALTASTFLAQMQSSDAFEYFTSAGVRYTGTGTTSLAASNLKATILGVNGIYANCTADGQTNCVTVSPYKAVNTSSLSAWDVVRGKTLGGVAGKMVRPRNGALLSFYNRTTGTASSASTTDADYNDTTDDSTVTGTAFPTMSPVPAISSWYLAAVDDIIIRDPATDTNGNGLCDAGEICQFYDRNTKKYWNRFDTSTVSWENAITACTATTANAYPTSGWRLPQQKEVYQLYIDGSAAKRIEFNIPNAYYWTSTTISDSQTSAWVFHPNNGDTNVGNKTSGTYAFYCIHD